MVRATHALASFPSGATLTQRSGWRAVLVGGGAAGTLDILFAISFAAYNGIPPMRLLQSVASGLLGTDAYKGGGLSAALGLVLHFALAIAFAGVFLLASRHFPLLRRRPVIFGGAFGVGVFVFMRLVALPLSAFPHPVSFRPLATALDLLSHIFLFGIPIALAVARVSPRGPTGGGPSAGPVRSVNLPRPPS
jgi:uncharacterized membrane protein YagU involved in acid resistance